MDAFYASVEERDRPQLKGQPVVVGGSASSRGVVAAANYVARRYGIHSAMPMATAQRLCSQLVILPVRMECYVEVSRQIHDIFQRYTPVIESLSLDEAFLDTGGSERLFGTPIEIARHIKHAIKEELNLTASVGIAPNKFLAKIASDLEKPDGFVVVRPERVQAFLDPLPVERLWGVGKVSAQIFDQLGIKTIRELRAYSRETLLHRLGKWGEQLCRLAHGIDNRRVVPEQETKSVSNETTFEADIVDPELLLAWLLHLTEQVSQRLRSKGLEGRTVRIKVRYADFKTITRSQTLTEPTNITAEIWRVAKQLFLQRLPKQNKPLRLIGIGVSGFDQPQVQADLFAQQGRKHQRVIDNTVDDIKRRFGSKVLHRGKGRQMGC